MLQQSPFLRYSSKAFEDNLTLSEDYNPQTQHLHIPRDAS